MANLVEINGKQYYRLYDENGNLPEEFKALDINIEESMDELKRHGLLEVIEIKGNKYYRALDPKSNEAPYNVLNF